MVNDPSCLDARAAERDLALGYAPAMSRAALQALFALDERLGAILRATREPMVGQMRLTWWHEALTALDQRPPPAEPVLAGLAAHVLPCGVSGGALAALVDGWEVLLDDPAPDLAAYATDRGGRLFALAGLLLRENDPRLAAIGEGWALADLSGNLSDTGSAARAAAMARERLAALGGGRWPRALRPLAALALLARSDVASGIAGSPGRVARLALMRVTGR